MRSVRSTLFGLLILGASAGMASAQATQPAPDASSRRTAMKEGRGPGRGARGLFRGIELTDAEKASLKTVRSKYKDQFKSLHDSFKPQREELRAARQRGDSAAAKAIWTKSADQREKARALETQMQGDLRAALTPAHREQFDKNAAVRKERAERRGSKTARRGDGLSLRAHGGGRRAR
jgi:Spy/CpxP family protein refolding chaperone